MQIIADRAQILHWRVAALLGHRDYNPFLIDIQAKIGFTFHRCVCEFELFILVRLCCGKNQQ